MTEEEQAINRQIAEILEQCPTRCESDGITVFHGSFSASKGWMFVNGAWRPRDFEHDEAANSILVDKFIALGFSMEVWPQAGDSRVIVVFRKAIGNPPHSAWTDWEHYGTGHLQPHRKAAVCAAFLAMHGVKI